MNKNGKKGFRAEFREFIAKGNVIDMAVGVIVGSAFTAIVTSLVDNIFNPIIGYFIGGVDFTDFKIELPQVIPGTSQATVYYGSFLQQVINFLIIAFVVFCMVKLINRFRRKEEKTAEAPEEPTVSAELQTLTEIRDLLKANAVHISAQEKASGSDTAGDNSGTDGGAGNAGDGTGSTGGAGNADNTEDTLAD